MANSFNKYSNYYDLVNSEKDYLGEVKYIQNLIKEYLQLDKYKLMDIGCGTGIHSEKLAGEKNYVLGIDTSKSMLKIAKERCSDRKNINFLEGDARSFRFNEKFDVITSLFHVINYQTTDQDLIDMIKTIDFHLDKKGIFIFDFWYKPAVLNLQPTSRTKHMENENIAVKRISNPIHYPDKNIVEVNFDIAIENKIIKKKESIKEKHTMRYFGITELKDILQTFSFEIKVKEEWLTKKEPSKKTWGVCIVASR